MQLLAKWIMNDERKSSLTGQFNIVVRGATLHVCNSSVYFNGWVILTCRDEHYSESLILEMLTYQSKSSLQTRHKCRKSPPKSLSRATLVPVLKSLLDILIPANMSLYSSSRNQSEMWGSIFPLYRWSRSWEENLPRTRGYLLETGVLFAYRWEWTQNWVLPYRSQIDSNSARYIQVFVHDTWTATESEWYPSFRLLLICFLRIPMRELYLRSDRHLDIWIHIENSEKS